MVVKNSIYDGIVVIGSAIDAILRDEEHSEDNSNTDDDIPIQKKHHAINRLSCKW